MNSEQIELLEKSKTAIEILDKILPELPEYGNFHFAFYAKEVLKWTPTEIREIAILQPHIIDIALNHFRYINSRPDNGYLFLNDKGREAKLKGGHFSYLKYLDEKKETETKRQDRKDKSDEVDLLMKKWTYKARYIPYIASLLALTISIISYFKPEKKQQDLQPMQQKIQELQKRVQEFDSLYRVDTLLKKGN